MSDENIPNLSENPEVSNVPMPDETLEAPAAPPELDDPFAELDAVEEPSVPQNAPVVPSEIPPVQSAQSMDSKPTDAKQPAVPAKSKRSFKMPDMSGWFTRKRLLLLAGAAMVIIIGVLLALATRQDTGSSVTSPLDELLAEPEPVNSAPATETPQTNDRDGDGLLDDEEATLGTDPNDVDTDGDGLSDRQEVRIYQTRPTNPDSDNDGFTDGEEVRSFYNPNGEGKMVDVEEAIEEYENEQR